MVFRIESVSRSNSVPGILVWLLWYGVYRGHEEIAGTWIYVILPWRIVHVSALDRALVNYKTFTSLYHLYSGFIIRLVPSYVSIRKLYLLVDVSVFTVSLSGVV